MRRLEPELAFVLSSVAAFFDSEKRQAPASTATGVNNWNLVVELADHHRLVFLLHDVMAASEWPGVPDATRNKLRAMRTAGAARYEFLGKEIPEVLSLFGKSGLKPLLFRGPFFARRYYGDPSLRQCDDLDIMVSSSEYLSAAEVLRTTGYSARPGLALSEEMDYVRRGWSVSFSRPTGCSAIDISIRLLPVNYAIPEQYEFWAQGAQSVEFDGARALVPLPHKTLLATALHGYKHLWKRLVWLADIAAISKSETPESLAPAWREAEALGAGRIMSFGFGLAKRMGWIGPHERPEKDTRRMFEAQADYALLLAREAGGRPANRLLDFVFQASLRDSAGDMLRFASAMLGNRRKV